MDTPKSKQLDSTLPLRVDKTMKWLEKSRYSWREKTKKAKDSLKKNKLAVKRSRASRDLLHKEVLKERTAYYRAREELSQKDVEIAALKAQLEKAHGKIETLKKKRLHL